MVCRPERFRLIIEAKNEEGEENQESCDVELVVVGDMDIDGVGTSSESEWIVISGFRDCEPMRIARGRGKT